MMCLLFMSYVFLVCEDGIKVAFGTFMVRVCVIKCDIPLPSIDMSDRIIWFHSINGCYFAKSGYSWLLLRRIGLGPYRLLWKYIWKLKLPFKCVS